jgi:hypothetical protein
MNVERRLRELLNVVLEEVRHNPTFAERLAGVLGAATGSPRVQGQERVIRSKASEKTAPGARGAKRGNRRALALVDPITEIEQGENHLRARLGALDLEQLRDVLAEYRMDPNKLVMKWKDRERVIDHIITTSVTRERKGDAFRA